MGEEWILCGGLCVRLVMMEMGAAVVVLSINAEVSVLSSASPLPLFSSRSTNCVPSCSRNAPHGKTWNAIRSHWRDRSVCRQVTSVLLSTPPLQSLLGDSSLPVQPEPLPVCQGGRTEEFESPVFPLDACWKIFSLPTPEKPPGFAFQ